ncbi:MAG: DUF302 domain-containing protein [Vulcanimicrobiaceae bacterium]
MKYGTTVTSPRDYATTIEYAKAALKDCGFGVLCEIDVAKTLKEKIGAEMEPYIILGACNPGFAHKALQIEPDLGLLLPCNVVVMQQNGQVYVKAIDAHAMLGVTGNPELTATAAEVNTLLAKALSASVA